MKAAFRISESKAAGTFLAGILVLTLFVGCQSLREPTSPEKLRLQGTLSGVVYLRDEMGHLLPSQAGTEVSLEEIGRKATTDDSGRWSFSGLYTGTYTVAFSKPGFGPLRFPGYQFVGGGETYFPAQCLTQIASLHISNLEIDTSPSNFQGVRVRFCVCNGSMEEDGRYVVFFLGNDSTVSSDPVQHAAWTARRIRDTSNSEIEWLIRWTSFRPTMPYPSGTTVYMVAYGAPNLYQGSTYQDPLTGKTVFPALNPTPSNVVNFEVP